MPDTTQAGLFCRVWCSGVNLVGPVSGQYRSVSGGAVRPPDALRLRAHLLGGLETQFTPPDTKQTALSCRVWRAV